MIFSAASASNLLVDRKKQQMTTPHEAVLRVFFTGTLLQNQEAHDRHRTTDLHATPRKRIYRCCASVLFAAALCEESTILRVVQSLDGWNAVAGHCHWYPKKTEILSLTGISHPYIITPRLLLLSAVLPPIAPNLSPQAKKRKHEKLGTTLPPPPPRTHTHLHRQQPLRRPGDGRLGASP